MSETTQPTQGSGGGFNYEKFAGIISEAVTQAVAKLRDKERPVEHFQSSKVSAFNPTGQKRPKLTRRVVFCSAEEREETLTNEEIELYNQVVPGRYNKRKWEVIERESDTPDDLNLLEIRIPNINDVNVRMELPSNGLKGILRQIIEEAAAQRAKAKTA